jgi:8-oxo-dGTP diphosphatase
MEQKKSHARSFTIRVYGIMINQNNEVLITDEFEHAQFFSKFPGGGLEWGEGLHDCLLREWKEELQLDIEITDHFYTTDFFQLSAFDSYQQVISVYYLVKPLHELTIKTSNAPFDFIESGQSQSFRWIAAKKFSPDLLTFPIDQQVAKMIFEKLLNK